MKRIILTAFTALIAISCVIDPYNGINNRTGNNLIKYSENILERFIIYPTIDLIFLLTLDEFLKLSPQEQNLPEWDYFRSRVEHYTDTHLRISSRGISVETFGKSLTDVGSYWIMNIIDENTYSYGTGNGYYWYDQYYTAPGHGKTKRISCTDRDRYEITDEKGGRKAMQLVLTAIPSQYGGYDFSGACTGEMEKDDKGLSAKFTLYEFIYRKKRIDEDGTGNSLVTVSYNPENLYFRVDTYHNDEPLDWCEIMLTPNSRMQYYTNLAVEEILPHE